MKQEKPVADMLPAFWVQVALLSGISSHINTCFVSLPNIGAH